MVTLLEITALLTLGGFTVAFFRRRLKRGSALAVMLAAFCALLTLGMPATASVSEFRRAETVVVKQGEVIKGDIFLFGERVRVEGEVEGDVFVFSHDVSINGHVGGDVICFAQNLQVNGKVDGNVRSLTNTTTIRGTVAKNVLTADDVVSLEQAGKIGGSLTAFVGNLILEGNLGRDLLSFSKHPTLSGKIGGGVTAKGQGLTISSTAEIGGPIKFTGDNPPDVSPQAKLASPVDYHKMVHKSHYREGHYYVWQVIWMAAFVLFGLVLLQVLPDFSKEATQSVERYGAAWGLGVLVFFGVPIAAIIACVTVVGLFIGITSLFLWYAGLYYAQIIVGTMVGQWLMGRTKETWPLIGRMAVGVVALRLCTTIPEIGGWVKLGIILWGVGALSLALYRRFQPRLAPGAPSSPAGIPPLPPNTTIGGAVPA